MGVLSDLLYTVTGSPQGCVLLFISYTDDCRSNESNYHLIKFSDDKCLSVSALRPFTTSFENMLSGVTTCSELNVNKTKYMVQISRCRWLWQSPLPFTEST